MLLGFKAKATLAIIKPDAIQHMREIIATISGQGFRISAYKTCILSYAQAMTFYEEHAGKDFFESLYRFMSFRPIVVLVLVNEDRCSNVVERWRRLIGSTDPRKAEQRRSRIGKRRRCRKGDRIFLFRDGTSHIGGWVSASYFRRRVIRISLVRA